MSDFSNKLKYLRKEKGLTQNELALALNISRSTVEHWEINRTEPNITQLIKVSDYFNRSIDYLLRKNVRKT